MEIILTLQRKYRTIAIIKNNGGEVVGKLNLPRFATVEEVGTMADLYRKEHLELFPELARRNENKLF